MTLEEMEKRLINTENALADAQKKLGAISDIEEIKQLQYRYINSVCYAQFNEISEYFAENSVIEFGPSGKIRGKENIVRHFNNVIAKWHIGQEGTFTLHPIIQVDGEKAHGSWVLYMMYFYPRTGQSLYWVQGVYDIEYIKENGKWKFNDIAWKERLGPPGGGPPIDPTQQ